MAAEEADHAEASRRIQSEQTRVPQLDLSTLFLTRLRPELKRLSSLQRSASRRRGVEADEERAGEVRPFQSSEEAGEQTESLRGRFWACGAESVEPMEGADVMRRG